MEASPTRPNFRLTWLATLAGALALGYAFGGGGPARPAVAADGVGGTDRVLAFTGQIDRDAWGLFLVDPLERTVCVYQVESVSGARRLRLLAARSYEHDRFLRDFNTDPDIRMIRGLVNKQDQMNRGAEPPEPVEAPAPQP